MAAAACWLPQASGLSPATALDAMFAPGVELGMSPPKSDPLGDYTVRLFDLADHIRASDAAAQQSRAVVPGASSAAGTAPSGTTADADADAILDGRIGISIVYCSGLARYAKLLPDHSLVPLPPELQTSPEYGLAVMKSAAPVAYQLALYILSPDGLQALADRGFRPVALPTP